MGGTRIWRPGPAPAADSGQRAGHQHFTWIDRAEFGGHDLLALLREAIERPGVMRDYSRAEVEAWGDYFCCAHQVKYHLLRRYGILAAAGDRHLAEFVPGFLIDEETPYRFGFSRTPMAYRYGRWEEAEAQTRALMAGERPYTLAHSAEEGVEQICALLGLGDLVTNCNRPNVGQMPDLPEGAVVETNARFSRDSVQPLAAGHLPAGALSLVAPHVRNQELMVQAALARDVDLAFQAVFSDPLTGLPIDLAWAMFREMLAATGDHLPGFVVPA